MRPYIDHIQITVQNLEEAEGFYDQFFSILGFDLSKKNRGRVHDHDFDVIEYVHPDITVGINSPREKFKEDKVHRRRPGALHHLAFRADNEAEVDWVYRQIKDSEIEIVSSPQFFPQHGAHYYALFIKDPHGIKYEVMFEK